MTVGALVDYLKAQSQKGVSHLYLSQPARDAIRTAVKAHKKVAPATAAAPAAPQQQAHPAAPAATQPSRQDRPTRPAPQQPVAPPPTAAAPPTPPAPSAQIVDPSSITITLPEGEAPVRLRALYEQASVWPPAHSLGTLRNRLVYATGSTSADIMVIDEAPGFDEEMTRKPFSGKSGIKLDQILKAMSLSRKDLYLTSLCKFRPKSPRQTTNVRKPSAQELAACLPLLQKEIEIIQPKCIIALGATGCAALLQQDLKSVATLRGTWQTYQGIPLLPSYHPTFLLRNANDKAAKRKFWEDMLTVMEFMDLPISDKQRDFFK